MKKKKRLDFDLWKIFEIGYVSNTEPNTNILCMILVHSLHAGPGGREQLRQREAGATSGHQGQEKLAEPQGLRRGHPAESARGTYDLFRHLPGVFPVLFLSFFSTDCCFFCSRYQKKNAPYHTTNMFCCDIYFIFFFYCYTAVFFVHDMIFKKKERPLTAFQERRSGCCSCGEIDVSCLSCRWIIS